MRMKIVDFIKNNKQAFYPIPKSGGKFDVFEEWFCKEFNIKPIKIHQKHYKL